VIKKQGPTGEPVLLIHSYKCSPQLPCSPVWPRGCERSPSGACWSTRRPSPSPQTPAPASPAGHLQVTLFYYNEQIIS